MPGMEAAGNLIFQLMRVATTVMMTMTMLTIVSLNQTSGTFRDQPNSRGTFLSSDCLDKP